MGDTGADCRGQKVYWKSYHLHGLTDTVWQGLWEESSWWGKMGVASYTSPRHLWPGCLTPQQEAEEQREGQVLPQVEIGSPLISQRLQMPSGVCELGMQCSRDWGVGRAAAGTVSWAVAVGILTVGLQGGIHNGRNGSMAHLTGQVL